MTFYQKIFEDTGLNNNGWFFVGIFLSLAGIMLFSFGIIIDLLIKIQLSGSQIERRYYVRNVVKK